MPEEISLRVRKVGTPLVEENIATFVWLGKEAPGLIGDFNDWEIETAVPLTRVSAGVWSASLEFPADTYMEYAFVRGKERVADPLNPRSIWNGIEDYNHFFYMPEGVPTPLAKRQPNILHGKVTSLTIDTDELAATPRRRVYLYEPPAKGPYPLLMVYDGRDYLRRAYLANIVDNLLAQGRIRPVALALVANGHKARSVEYTCSEATLGLLLAKVLPLAQKRLDLLDIKAHPGSFGVLGASLGGLMALFAGLRYPQVFGKVLSQSGAFSLFEGDTVVYDLVTCREKLPLEIWMDAGKYEWLLETNQRMSGLLAGKASRVEYHEYNGGHNYTAWQNDVWQGLEYLFGKDNDQSG